MKSKIGCLFWSFLVCWFIGALVISTGLGSFFPSINLVSKPLLCPHGKMAPQKHVYRPYPGTTIINVSWSCTDERSGAKTEVSDFLVTLISGVFYGALLLGLGSIVEPLLLKRAEREPQAGATFTPADVQRSGDSLERMQELKELHDGKLISDTEYEEKRKEILKNL